VEDVNAYPSVCPSSVRISIFGVAITALAVTAGGCAAISDPQQTRDFFARGQCYYRSRRIAVAVPLDIAVTTPLDAG
jgi:hypothetical protein